jgi:hypothetical protein
MMGENLGDLASAVHNFNWNLEGIKFDDRVFFLKVTRWVQPRLNTLPTLSLYYS